MAQPKWEEIGSLSKYERQLLQRLYTECGSASGSLRNFVKSSNLPVTKVREFWHSNPSHKKITLATRNFNRFRAFVKFKDDFWCMDLAYIDKLAKDNNGVKYLLVRQDVFDGNVHAKKMKAKDCKRFVHVWLWLQKVSTHKNLGRLGIRSCWRV